jgi:alpha-beta hydrolase superfamily lysophospholipase
MNIFYRAALWLSVRLIPGAVVDGRQFNIWPSDNIAMLRALGRDPLIYKNSRVDTVYGLVNLMDAALASADRQSLPTLLLYGAKDRIIPPEPVEIMREHLSSPYWVALYPDGWHMLFRDLEAKTVWRDVAAWIADHDAPLPSGHEHDDGPLFAGN